MSVSVFDRESDVVLPAYRVGVRLRIKGTTGFQDVGFRGLGLGFKVWGLGFGVWSLGVMVRGGRVQGWCIFVLPPPTTALQGNLAHNKTHPLPRATICPKA